MSQELTPKKPILIAAITGAFGAKGEVRIKSFTDEPAACLDYAPFVNEAGEEVLRIAKSRPVKGGFALKCKGIQYRDQAEALRGTKLYCLAGALPKQDADEFYHLDLVGLSVVSHDGQPLGRVHAVQNYGASDLLEICETPKVKGSWMLPFTLAHVPQVDLDEKQIVLADWQEYLPDVKAAKKGGA